MILAADVARHWLTDNKTLYDMFHIAIPIAEKMARPIVVYVFLVVALRVFGKRELTNINPFDFVVLLTLSNTVQNAIIGDDNTVTGGLIGALTLLAVNYLVVRFLFKHRRLDEVVQGKPTVLIQNGKLCEKNLARELLTKAELITVAHRQGYGHIDEVDYCELEPGGNFYLRAKEPDTEESRHAELLKQLSSITKQIEAIERGLRKSQ